jgi:uncharacterized protein with GYD domain
MLTFMCQGRFTGQAVKGMAARPEDRSEQVNKLLESAGGRLLGWWFAFGDFDFLLICETPSEKEMASVVIAATAAGGVTGLKTTLLLTGPSSKDALKDAGELGRSFRPAGREGPQYF